jgi:hypothetical protein
MDPPEAVTGGPEVANAVKTTIGTVFLHKNARYAQTDGKFKVLSRVKRHTNALSI